MTGSRIVSLLPSATEILYWLGLGDRVVGVTYECTVPAEAASRPHVTDTIIPTGATPGEIDAIIRAAMADGRPLYTLDRDLLASLDADLIVTQDLCRVCALPAGDVDAAVASLGCRAEVCSYDPMTLDEVFDGIEMIAEAAGAGTEGHERIAAARARLMAQRARGASIAERPRVLLLEWVDPPFGPGHWIPDQLEAAGAEPLLHHAGGRSSTTTWDAVVEADPDVILVAPCGFDADAAAEQCASVLARPELADVSAVRTGRVCSLDGDAHVVRPGPRLLDGIDVMFDLVHDTESGPANPEQYDPA